MLPTSKGHILGENGSQNTGNLKMKFEFGPCWHISAPTGPLSYPSCQSTHLKIQQSAKRAHLPAHPSSYSISSRPSSSNYLV